jgi:predicted HD phosphohydrolase
VLEPILTSVFLRYRHVNQAERWQREEMQANGTVFSAEIPADYTQSPFALEYCFELRAKDGSAWLAPGFNAALSSQPYYAVVRKGA